MRPKTFVLTNHLFEMGIRTPRVRELLEVAVPVMRALTRDMAQSAHLVVPSRGETVVIAAIAGGADMSFTLRLGYRRPLTDASSGRVILAFQRDAAQRSMGRAEAGRQGVRPRRARRGAQAHPPAGP